MTDIEMQIEELEKQLRELRVKQESQEKEETTKSYLSRLEFLKSYLYEKPINVSFDTGYTLGAEPVITRILLTYHNQQITISSSEDLYIQSNYWH